ncbi:hypothetical protein WJR50_17665 [Catalinimonas sp. 4WD22]|uniref:hypothetical protein n=1 Tax=Catalinimonas locisalis TaxID=3133978 RepID=UPI003100D3F8
MKYFLTLVTLFLSLSLSAQKYYVLHVVGDVTTDNSDTVRIKNHYEEGQKFNFEDSLGLIVFLNEKVGKVVLKPLHKKSSQQPQKQNSNTLQSLHTDEKNYVYSEIIALSSKEVLPLTSSTFTRGSVGIINHLDDFQLFFQIPHLLLDTITIDYNQNYFPIDQNNYFFIADNSEKKKKINAKNGQLLLTETLFRLIDSSYQKQNFFHTKLFQHKNQINYPITEFTIVKVENQQLMQQANMIIEAGKKGDSNSEIELIKQIHLFFNELYGSCTRDEVKAWLYNHSLL